MRLRLAALLCGLVVLGGCGGGNSVSTPTTNPNAPVASPGGPYSGNIGSAISFNGAASSDPRSQTLTYFWSFGDGSTGATATPTHTYAPNGFASTVDTVTLTVTDTSGLSNTASTTVTLTGPKPLADGALTGVVSASTSSAGQIPVENAHVYLFAANNTGYGGAGIPASSSNASLSLLAENQTGSSDSLGAYVLTNYAGAFSLSGDYSCTAGQQLYIYAIGGGAGGGSNPSSGLLAAIGSCPSTGSTSTVVVNEETTVAASFALAGFATDATHISSSATAQAQANIANAFANAADLVSLSTGIALTETPTNSGASPQATVNTLADILATCVYTANSCGTILSTATSDGTATGTRPTDTASATINIAHNPAANVATLYALANSIVPSPPFSPLLSTQPNDFTLAITYNTGGFSGIEGIAIDAAGDAWIANSTTNSITEISGSGTILSGASGYKNIAGLNKPYGIAIDGSGNAWIANFGASSLSEVTSTGAAGSGSPYVGGGLNQSAAIAIDGQGNIWLTNPTVADISEFNSSGTALSGTTGYTAGGVNAPAGIAIDGSGNAWIADSGTKISELTSAGAAVSGSPYSGGGVNGPQGIAIDGSGNVWIANNTGNSVSKLSKSGTAISGANGYTGGGLSAPKGIAIDGAGNAWVASASSLVQLSSAGSLLSGANGYAANSVSTPLGIAVDGAGNVWTTNSGNNTVTVLVGAAAPVVTPLSAAVKTNTIGTRP